MCSVLSSGVPAIDSGDKGTGAIVRNKEMGYTTALHILLRHLF
jgi:hypothetical protein